LIYIGYDWNNHFPLDDAERTMVNLTAVLPRLQTNPEEVRQWVQFHDRQRKLFHYVLDFDFGESVVEQVNNEVLDDIEERTEALKRRFRRTKLW
jgi:hypothetical protein